MGDAWYWYLLAYWLQKGGRSGGLDGDGRHQGRETEEVHDSWQGDLFLKANRGSFGSECRIY